MIIYYLGRSMIQAIMYKWIKCKNNKKQCEKNESIVRPNGDLRT